MTVPTFLQPNFTTQSAAVYKAAIDAAIAVLARQAAGFAAHEQDASSPQPDMTVRVDAGQTFTFGFAAPELREIAAQTVSGFTTPAAGYERIDRVVIDPLTGAATRVAGTAQTTGSPGPSAPAIPAGKLPVCQVLITDSDTVITNDMITDERPPGMQAGPQFAFGSFTHDVSVTGAQSITGLPFEPRAILFFGVVDATSAFGIGGVVEGYSQGTVYDSFQDAAESYGLFTNNCMAFNVGVGATAAFSFTSSESDGFTVTWSKSGSPTGTATTFYLAFGG